MSARLENWHFACAACGLERSTLSPRINELDSIDERAREAALRPIRDHNFQVLVQWLNGRLRSRVGGAAKPKLLDVGCAHGWFLKTAAVDYDVLGLEPDARIAEAAQGRNLPVRKGYFPAALDAAEQFDVIVFNDVLEHIPEVKNVLRACAARLRRDGVVVVNAPDRRGLFYRLSKLLAKAGQPGAFHRMWQVDLPSPHLYYFDTASMNRIAEASGFRVVAERPLTSIVAKGLYSRVHYAGTPSRFRSAVTAAGILALIPLLKLFPSDITVWALEKRKA
ncbi:MAG: methyltransferase domain protein [Ramlibacter sp.]|nr:methyltransferase domain protein [Ramlibacter sp.]